MTPKSYIEEVDKMYLACRLKRLSRFSNEWDTFSRKINGERLEVIKNLDNEKTESLLNQCLSYWFNCSELLELHFHYKLFRQNKRKKLTKEGKKIREDILKGKMDTVLGTGGIVELFAKYHRTNSKGCEV